MKTHKAVMFAVWVGISCVGSASAQVQRSGAANAQLMQQYQQAVAERSQLQVENAKLRKDADELKKQLGQAQQQATAAKAGAARNQALVATARAANDETQKSLDDLKGKMQELVSHFRETITTLHAVETERTQLQQQLTESRAAFDRCAERNFALYQVNGEILDRYEHQSAFSYLARAEPFTRLKRTRIENLVDEYRQRAEELRVKKAQASADSASGVTPPKDH